MPTYTASHGVGPRLPAINRRVTPTEGNDFEIRTDILKVVQHPVYTDVGYVRLYERPLTTVGGSMITVTETATGATLDGTITFPPGEDKFFVAPYQQLIFFPSAKVGVEMKIDYTGMGSIVDAIDINYLLDLASVNKFLSPDIDIEANGTYTIDKKIVTEVYVKIADNQYKLAGEGDVEVNIWYPEDMDNYYSTIRNLDSSNPITIKYRATQLFIPEN